MMQSMKGATQLLGSMNRQMNLPALQRIAMEFEKENDIMDQRQEMMDDAIDDVTGLEDEEEGEEVVQQVLDEIGIDLGQAVSRNAMTVMLGAWLILASSETHHRDCRRTPWRKAVLLRLSAEETPEMMISRRGLIAFGDEESRFIVNVSFANNRGHLLHDRSMSLCSRRSTSGWLSELSCAQFNLIRVEIYLICWHPRPRV
jgi:hypothetical protein